LHFFKPPTITGKISYNHTIQIGDFMKNLIPYFTVLLLSLASSGALAYSPIDCFKEAYALSSIKTDTVAATLCQGATTSAPIDCFKEAYALSSIKTDVAAAVLCQGAISNAPVTCFQNAYALNVVKTDESAATLCKGAR
jgi:hypothetical protein